MPYASLNLRRKESLKIYILSRLANRWYLSSWDWITSWKRYYTWKGGEGENNYLESTTILECKGEEKKRLKRRLNWSDQCNKRKTIKTRRPGCKVKYCQRSVPRINPTTRSKGMVPKTVITSNTDCKSEGHPQTTLSCNNSLEGFIELLKAITYSHT